MSGKWLTPTLWKTALRIAEECEKRGEKIGRYKLSEALELKESRARLLVAMLENREIIRLKAQEFQPATKELIISDLHIPYHDEIAVETALTVAEKETVDTITILGDLIDFYQISTFAKNPKKKSVEQELRETKKFLEDLRARFPKARIIYLEGNHECVSPDTEILTKDGWKLAEEITYADEVAQFDIETGEISFTPPLAISEQEADNLVEVKTNQGYEKVTFNHCLVVDNKRVKVSDLIEKGFTQTQQRFAGKLAKEYRNKIDYSNDWLRLLTWVIMDGTWVIEAHGKKRIQFKLSKKRKITSLINLLNRLDIPHTVRLATMSTHNKLQPFMIRIYGEFARKIIDDLNGKKEFPSEWAFGLNKKQLMAVINTIKETDGSPHFNHMTWSSTNKHNIEVIQMACIFNGIPCKYRVKYKWSGFDTKHPRNPLYLVSIYHNGVFGSHAKFEISHGKQRVIAITTPKETLITRVEGKVNFTGNSRLQRYLWQKTPEIYSLIENLLGNVLTLNKLNIEFLTDPFRIGKLWHLHGHEKQGRGNPKYITHVYMSIILDHFIVGHFHRNQSNIFKRINEKTFFAGAVGMLAKNEALEYAKINNWTQGFAIVEYNKEGFFKCRIIPIKDGQVYR